MTSVVVTLPIRLVSEPNTRSHYQVRAKRVRQQRAVTCMSLGARLPASVFRDPPAWTVCIIRFGKKCLDGDNLQGACKAVRDGVADALGVDDGDPRITWTYDQVKAPRYEVVIEVSVP